MYSCTARGETGPEALYALQAAKDCRASVRIGELETDLDLLALETCEASSCTESSVSPLDLQADERVELDVAGRDWLIVVDGYDGSSGTFEMAVDCLCGEAAAGFRDGAFRLEVDRRWSGELTAGATMSEPLDEGDYEPLADGPTHDVTIGDGWRLAMVGDAPMRGVLRESAEEGELHYELEDAFAGGRFVIWAAEGGLEAELTLYGSGVPIASSERGSLVRVP